MDNSADLNPTARKFYGNAPPAPAPAPTSPEEKVARLMYGTPDDRQTEFYPVSTALATPLSQREAELQDALGWGEKELADRRRSAETIGARTGLDPYHLVPRIIDYHDAALLAQARGRQTEADVETQTREWNEESRRALRETYGDEASDLMARAAKFVNQSPELAQILGVAGIGSRKDVVTKIVEHVRRVNYR